MSPSGTAPASSTPWWPLVPHPVAQPPAGGSLVASARFGPSGALELAYRLACEAGAIRLPAKAPPARVDGLWRHTCFECFIACEGAASYLEFNFSPSGEWAAYAFRAYRDGADHEAAAPSLDCVVTDGGLLLRATVPDAALPRCDGVSARRLALSAVLEAGDGSLSWWALAHPGERPDFHHRGGFVLRAGASDPVPDRAEETQT